MDEKYFLQTIQQKATELQINPFLLLSGIEGLYSFRHVPIDTVNSGFLDSLILTIFALRIGDHYHSLAEGKLADQNEVVRQSAQKELTLLSQEHIAYSNNPYLKSFAHLVEGKAVLRRYHEKALEVAALEISRLQARFQANSISTVMLDLCKNELNTSLNLSGMFQN